MISFRINGKFLEMFPNTQIDLEETSPFLQFGEELEGSFSFPFDIPATDHNMRILGYPNKLHSQKVKKFDAICYDGTIQHSVGKLVIKAVDGFITSGRLGKISCYYLTSTSNFFQDVAGVNLRSLDWGGMRTFSHGDNNYRLSQSAFWRHLNQAAAGNVDQFDYTFFPVINRSWNRERGNIPFNFMNGWSGRFGNSIEFKFHPLNIVFETDDLFPAHNPITPFPYLVYVLKNIFKQVGWELRGDILNDATFKKVVLLSFREIYHGFTNGALGILRVPETVSFDLKNYLPNVTVAEFLIAIKNRLGISFDFSRTSKVAVVVPYNDLVINSNQDITLNVSNAYRMQNEDGNIYAIRQTGAGGSSIDFSQINFRGNVNRLADLPAASQSNFGQVYLVAFDNSYYICENAETGGFEWQVYNSNSIDYEPAGNNQSISTQAFTVDMERSFFQTGNVNNYQSTSLFPRFDFAGYDQNTDDGESSWPIVLAMSHGMRTDIENKPIPYGSNHILAPNGQRIADWALTFTFPWEGAEWGSYERFYRKFFDTIDGAEYTTISASMSRAEYESIRFAESLIINHSKHYLRKKKARIPFSGQVVLEIVKA